MLTIKKVRERTAFIPCSKKFEKKNQLYIYTKQPKRQSKMEKRYSLFDRENDISFVTVIIVLQWWSFFFCVLIYFDGEYYNVPCEIKFFCKI